MARFTTLYSGSSGNCAVVEDSGEFLLVDMGASCKATLGGLVAAGLSPKNLRGILITHEHSDHIKGLAVFLKRIKVPVYSTPATLRILYDEGHVPDGTALIETEVEFQTIGGFRAQCFPTSHDAADSCGWRIETKTGRTITLATDLGVVTEEVYSSFAGTHLAVLEANYDPVMLQLGPYPGYLKKRISSQIGHLANPDAARTAARLVGDGCKKIALCHLSQENNRPNLVMQAVQEAFLNKGIRMQSDYIIQVAKRHEVSDWIEF